MSSPSIKIAIGAAAIGVDSDTSDRRKSSDIGHQRIRPRAGIDRRTHGRRTHGRRPTGGLCHRQLQPRVPTDRQSLRLSESVNTRVMAATGARTSSPDQHLVRGLAPVTTQLGDQGLSLVLGRVVHRMAGDFMGRMRSRSMTGLGRMTATGITLAIFPASESTSILSIPPGSHPSLLCPSLRSLSSLSTSLPVASLLAPSLPSRSLPSPSLPTPSLPSPGLSSHTLAQHPPPRPVCRCQVTRGKHNPRPNGRVTKHCARQTSSWA